MEIWELKGRKWEKRPFKPFPSKEPLAVVMINHQLHHCHDHWVVFTKEEEKLLAEMAKPFLLGKSAIAITFLSLLIGTALKARFAPAPLITYFPANPELPMSENKEMLLAIHFNWE